MNTEPYAMRTEAGLEVLTNDKTLRYVLRKNRVLTRFEASDIYLCSTCVRDGDRWVKTSETACYTTIDEFVKTIKGLPEFSKASQELDE